VEQVRHHEAGRRLGQCHVDPWWPMTAAEEEAAARLETLARLQHGYDETKNPLYVWEAITWCLHADDPPTIPGWCLNYLREAATNIYALSCGKNFRNSKSPAFPSTEQAVKLVAEALLLSKQGKRNAFAALLKDRDDQRDANSVIFSGEATSEETTISHREGKYFVVDVVHGTALERIAKRRSVTKDRAKRIVARGKSPLRQGLRQKKVKPHP
jgi:hypothetical protein